MGVIGVDTPRDFHQVEIARPSGAVIATRTVTNDSTGHAEALAWIFAHSPGPRLVLSIEGTRSYGAGLARAAATAGLAVIEANSPPAPTAGARTSPTGSTRTWRCSTPWVSTPTRCPLPVLMATARPCGFCSAPARS
jgi:hypothetical protein